MTYSLRLGRESDHPYVVSSWIASAQPERPVRKSKAIYRSLIARSMLRIAHVPEDPDAILGWSVVEYVPEGPPCVHYCYVRGGETGCRRIGIARALLCDLLDAPVEYSHPPEVKVPIPKLWKYAPWRRE